MPLLPENARLCLLRIAATPHREVLVMGKEDCCESECCCEEEKKSQSMTGLSLEIGDKAWSKVLQRKMEARLEKEKGKQMEKVASVAYEYVNKYYKASMQGKALPKSEIDAFEKKLNDAMMG